MYVKHLVLASLSTTCACGPGTSPPDGPVAGSCLMPETNPPQRGPSAPCPILICGDNAPTAGDGLLFDELDLFGEPNYAGVRLAGKLEGGRILSATLPNKHLAWIDIQADRLIAHDSIESDKPYEGLALIGTVIHLQGETERFELRVACYDDHSQRFLAGPADFVAVYDFQARRFGPNEQWFEVCNGEPLLRDPTWTGSPHHALLYRGDRYVPQRKMLQLNDPSSGWSFIACNGSAGTKMHLHRHTEASQILPGLTTTLENRTTLLKAITADYCGTGTPDFTEPGQHISVATALNPSWFPNPWPSVTDIEALWGPNGASCINTPRPVFGYTRDIVNDKCHFSGPSALGPCEPGTPPPAWDSSHHAITGNPP